MFSPLTDRHNPDGDCLQKTHSGKGRNVHPGFLCTQQVVAHVKQPVPSHKPSAGIVKVYCILPHFTCLAALDFWEP